MVGKLVSQEAGSLSIEQGLVSNQAGKDEETHNG